MMQTSPAKSQFGTKAEAIERIAPLLTYCKVLPWYSFCAGEWAKDSTRIVETILDRFGGRSLIIRSSSLEEDSDQHSMAGAFASVVSKK